MGKLATLWKVQFLSYDPSILDPVSLCDRKDATNTKSLRHDLEVWSGLLALVLISVHSLNDSLHKLEGQLALAGDLPSASIFLDIIAHDLI